MLRPPRMRPVLLLVSVVLVAAAAEPFSLPRLQAVSASVATVRVAFTQEKHLAILDEPLIAVGLVEISRPLQAVRWEFTGRSLVVWNRGRLRRWGADGKEESVGGRDAGVSALGDQMQGLLTGDFSALGRVFTVTPAADGSAHLVLVPLKPELTRFLTGIDMRFRDDLTAPSSMVITAAGGDTTAYTFAAPELGVAIATERFTGP